MDYLRFKEIVEDFKNLIFNLEIEQIVIERKTKEIESENGFKKFVPGKEIIIRIKLKDED
jgi:hypothetical protein